MAIGVILSFGCPKAGPANAQTRRQNGRPERAAVPKRMWIASPCLFDSLRLFKFAREPAKLSHKTAMGLIAKRSSRLRARAAR